MSFLPAFGQMCTLFPLKLVYLLSILVFEIGSTVSASAPTSEAFIIGRLISGAAGGGLWCGTLTVMGQAVPVRKRHLYVSIVTSMYGVASAAGPLLGGNFTDSPTLTWRFCFWVNLRKNLSLEDLNRKTLTLHSDWFCGILHHCNLPQAPSPVFLGSLSVANAENRKNRHRWSFSSDRRLCMSTPCSTMGRYHLRVVQLEGMGLPAWFRAHNYCLHRTADSAQR